jgi:hypothetical protein
MADLVFIVSRTEAKQYFYLKHEFADESRDVVLDRRLGERRRSLRPPPIERRHIDRRHRDVTRELQSSGWAGEAPGGVYERQMTSYSPVSSAEATSTCSPVLTTSCRSH